MGGRASAVLVAMPRPFAGLLLLSLFCGSLTLMGVRSLVGGPAAGGRGRVVMRGSPSSRGGCRERWWNAASSLSAPLEALDEACRGLGGVQQCEAAARGGEVLCLCFVSRAHVSDVGVIAAALEEKLEGCAHTSAVLVGGGVIGGAGDEREDLVTSEAARTSELVSKAAPGLSILCGALPRGSAVRHESFGPRKSAPGKRKRDAWRAAFGVGDESSSCEPGGFLVVGDTGSRWVGSAIAALDLHFPKALVFGRVGKG